MTRSSGLFSRFSGRVAEATARPASFVSALAMILIWGLSGPYFHFSDTWQMIVNTGTTIITFLMVFLLQNSQSRDSLALQTKLDELILATRADNRYVGVENLDGDELRRVSIHLVEEAGTSNDESPLDEPPHR